MDGEGRRQPRRLICKRGVNQGALAVAPRGAHELQERLRRTGPFEGGRRVHAQIHAQLLAEPSNGLLGVPRHQGVCQREGREGRSTRLPPTPPTKGVPRPRGCDLEDAFLIRVQTWKRCREYIWVNFVRRSGFEAPGKALQVYACVHFLLVDFRTPS